MSAPGAAGGGAGRLLPRRLKALVDRATGAERRRIVDNELRRAREERRALLKEVRVQGKQQRRVHERLERHFDEQAAELLRQREILQLLYDDEPATRRRLRRLRAGDDYELAFTEPEPLVSIVIPTYDNHEGLRTRALPSALAQGYPSFEVLVVGDCAPRRTAEVVASFGDARIRYHNRERRGPYPSEPRPRRYVQGVPPFNEALELARGRWIAPFADDDALRPHHLATLVAAAQRGRHELCYGRFARHMADGRVEARGSWPPESGSVALQAAIYHRGLSGFLQHELADALFERSADKSLLRRMLRTGVRFGFVDDVLVDYFYDPPEETRKKPRPAG